jgi:lipid-A-disaccharide synthase
LEDKPLIALLPGSRKMEIGKMLKVMLGVVKDFPGYQFVIAGAPSIGAEFYRSLAGNSGARIVHGQTYDLLKNSAAAVVTSGTATLETALLDVPQVVCYKGSSISYLIARQVIRVKFISLVNLIANRKVVNELIQNEFEVNALAREIKQLLKEENRKQMLEGYNDVRSALGGKGASKRAATAMVQYLRRNEVNNG